MAELEDVNLRVRAPGDLYERFTAVLEERQISAQRAFVALMEFIIDEDPLTQAMIFKQVPKTDRAELSRIVLERLAKSAKKRLG